MAPNEQQPLTVSYVLNPHTFYLPYPDH